MAGKRQVWVADIDIVVGERKYRAGDELVDVREKNLEPMRRLGQAHAEWWPEADQAADAGDAAGPADGNDDEPPKPKKGDNKKAKADKKGRAARPARQADATAEGELVEPPAAADDEQQPDEQQP